MQSSEDVYTTRSTFAKRPIPEDNAVSPSQGSRPSEQVSDLIAKTPIERLANLFSMIK